jgi:phage/plasmid-associated DNA primase
MLGMIDITSRFEEETYWLDVGAAIKKEFGYSGFGMWVTLTERSFEKKQIKPSFLGGKPARLSSRSSTRTSNNNKTIEDVCKNAWGHLNGRNITVSTLGFYARIDSPEKYKDWHTKWVKEIMVGGMLDGTDYQVAVAFYRMYWLEFIYAPGEGERNGKWYKFKDHHLQKDKEGLCIKLALMKDFKAEVLNLQAQFAALASNPSTPNPEQMNHHQKKLHVVSNNLEQGGKVDSVLRVARAVFGEYSPEKFTSLLNSNQDVSGVENGVIDAGSSHIIFRAGKPEDFIDFRMNVPYQNDLSMEHEDVKTLTNWFDQMWPEPDINSFMLRFFASFLRGGQREKIFPTLTGVGDNAKTALVELFEKTMGDYVVKLSASVLSEKASNSGSASPQFFRLKNKRGIFLDEPEGNDKIKTGLAKRMVGRDSFYARALHENGEDIQMTGKVCLVTNDVPSFDRPDAAMKSRYAKIDMKTRYVAKEDAPAGHEEQKRLRIYPRDETFTDKLHRLAPAFLWLLVHIYPSYISQPLVIPKSIKESTIAYWNESDPFFQFVNENMKKDETDSVKRNYLGKEFVTWYRVTYSMSKAPYEPEAIRKKLDEKLGPVTKKGEYEGWRYEPNLNVKKAAEELDNAEDGVKVEDGDAKAEVVI